jgi:soluble lytic murein transglycosylase-like protein
MTLLLSFLLFADVAVLTTGARLRAERVERDGQKVILHQGAGRIEIDASMLAEVEHLPEPAPAAAAATAAAPAPPVVVKSARELITEAAERHGLPPEIVHALVMTESAYQENAVSPKGAIGLMQLMPGTARALEADPYDVRQNIDAGTRLLRDLLLKYENDERQVSKALAAYNAGAGAVARYGGVPPYRETVNYIEKVLERYWRLKKSGSQEAPR